MPLTYALACSEANFLLADCMGAGKSAEAVLVTLHTKFSKLPVLIVGPANVVDNWVDELDKLFNIKAHVLTEPLKELIPGVRFYICSYGQLKKQMVDGKKMVVVKKTVTVDGKKKVIKAKELEKIPSPLFRKDWFILVDESLAIKKRTTLAYKRLKKFRKYSTNMICMTGTPCDRSIDLFTTLDLLIKNFMSYTAFAELFCGMHWNKGRMVVTGATNMAALNKLMRENCLIRRTKEQLLPFLPPKTRQTFNLGRHSLPKSKSALQMFTDNAKYKAADPDFKEWLTQAMDVGEKVLVFGHHKETLKLAETICKENGWKFVRIDGATSNRQELVRQFQNDPTIHTFIISLTAGGMGLNITAANISIYPEWHWSPAVMNQADERAHRPGQLQACYSLYPLLTTFDHYIRDIMFSKMENSMRIVDGGIDDDVSSSDILRQIAVDYDVPLK